jgi:putative thioredoxin
VSQWVFDTGDKQFESEVIERSKEVPVVVDFWAPWCGPCRTLGPLLERLATEHQGAFVLAKVNVDESPGLAQAFGISSIPMVIGLRDGKIAGEFVGALPEAGVRQFLSQLMPSEAEQLAQQGDSLHLSGRLEEAEATFRRALELDPRCDRALLGLAGVLADRDQEDDALALLDRILPGSPSRQDADRLAATIRVRQAGGGDEKALRAKVAGNPDDLEARFTLGQVLAAASHYDEALEQYLEIVKRDRTFREDGARKAMLDVFELLGSGNEVVDRYRSKLAQVLFR